jgi:hypothetical protein
MTDFDDILTDYSFKDPADKRSSAEAGPAAPGMSNTRSIDTKQQSLNVFIDYLVVRLHGKFSPNSESDLMRLDPLFKLLMINPQYYSPIKSGQWNNFIQFDDGTFMKSSSEYNASKDGDVCYLELKGEGCRAFEQRGGNWKDLISWLADNVNHVNRIDVSMDDINGVITMPQILDRIYKGSFTTSLRTWRTIDGKPVSGNEPNILRSKNDGCTISFGGRTSKQLVIYNKAAERISKHYVVEHGSWVRYETRFMHDFGYDTLMLVNQAMKEDKFGELTCGLIKGLVDFKEYGSDSNLSRRPTWKLWDELLQRASKINPQKQNVLESSLAKKQAWLRMASGRILSKAFLAKPEEFDYYIKHSVAQMIDKFTYVDLAQVNNLRLATGDSTITMESALTQLKNNFSAYYFPSEYLSKVLKKDEVVDFYPDELPPFMNGENENDL